MKHQRIEQQYCQINQSSNQLNHQINQIYIYIYMITLVIVHKKVRKYTVLQVINVPQLLMPFQEPFLLLLLLRRLLRILHRRQPPCGNRSLISATHAGAQGHVIHTLIVIWAVAVINNPLGASPALIVIRVLSATVVARDGIAGVASVGVVLIIGRVVVASDGVSSVSSPVVHSNTIVQAAVRKPVIGFVDGSQGGARAGVGDGWARPLLGQFLLLHAPGNTSNSKTGKRTSQRTNVWCELTETSAYCQRKGENAFCHAMPETTLTASIRKRGKEEGKNAQEATHESFFKSHINVQIKILLFKGTDRQSAYSSLRQKKKTAMEKLK